VGVWNALAKGGIPIMTELSNLRRSRDDQTGLVPRGEPSRAAASERVTIVLSPIADERFSSAEPGIRIKAQPARDGRSCRFMLNRDVLPGHSWRFDHRARAEGSALAAAVFELREVRTVSVYGSIVTVELDEPPAAWPPLAAAIGAALRAQLETGIPPIAEAIVSAMPSEHALRETITRAIDEEINPGLAGHGGLLSLVDVQGNTLFLRMGGGCQGCMAAEDTMKLGIDEALRRWEPRIGVILDATDHGAGRNPFYVKAE
jgi:Fe-S cluster biogenesis protein NfuA